MKKTKSISFLFFPIAFQQYKNINQKNFEILHYMPLSKTFWHKLMKIDSYIQISN